MHIRVTLNTSALPADVLVSAAGTRAEFKITTVTLREAKGKWVVDGYSAADASSETAVYDESCWDESVWAEDNDPLDEILSLLSSGSFPKGDMRDSLSKGRLHQLRDAMVLAAHVREARDILVSDDRKAYIDHG